MKKHCFSLIAAVVAAASPLSAQTDTDTDTESPAIEPAAEPRRGGGFEGFDFLGSERPEGAQTEITARRQATFDNESGTAEFEGSVLVRDPQFNLTCDHLKVVLRPDRRGMERVEATGNVRIVQENKDDRGQSTTSRARAGKAIYIPETGDITLIQWPEIEQGINRHVATEERTVMTLNREGRSTTEGGSRTFIVDTGDAAR